MKTILKLVIAVALLNALIRGGDAVWSYYQLKDAAQQTLLFGTASSASELQAQILSIAMAIDVPLKPEGLTVRRQGTRSVVEATYTQVIEFFPNYPYPVEFSFVVDAISVGVSTDSLPKR